MSQEMRMWSLFENVVWTLVVSAMASPLCAAEIHVVHGKVLVNSGTGFSAIENATALKAGDVAIAAQHGLGRVTHKDGCTVDVVPGSIAWIREYSPCAPAPGALPSRDPEQTVTPKVTFDRAWLFEGAAMINGRKPPAGP